MANCVPTVIDWRITDQCDNVCSHCYASEKLEPLSEEEFEKVVCQIISSGCEAVCISGGEPLLFDKTFEVVKRLHNSGIKVFLSTNGSHYVENISLVEPYLSKLSLPLDGYDRQSNMCSGRSDSSFDTVVSILRHYEQNSTLLPIKIGTVLSRNNSSIGHFEKMRSFLRNYPVNQWKIYEFIPEGSAASQLELCCDSSSVKRIAKHIERNATSSDDGFSISLHSRSSRSNVYFIVRCDGSVIIPIDDGRKVSEVVIGDLKSEKISEVVDRWRCRVNQVKASMNTESRFAIGSRPKLRVDDTDKLLLYHIDEKPLQSTSSLASKLSISPKEVDQRIAKLFSMRALRHIMPIVNVAQFGLEVFLLNLYFCVSDSIDKANIVDILCNDPYIAWVAECSEFGARSSKDSLIFRISIFAKDNYELHERIRLLSELFGSSLCRYEIDMVPEKYVCSQRFLVDNSVRSGITDSHITLSSPKCNLSLAEFKVLSAMRSCDRLSYESVAGRSFLTEKAVKRLIDSLLSRAVINKFQAVLDAGVLGYSCYLVFVKFRNSSDKLAFERHVLQLSEVTHVNTLNAGRWDIDVEMHVRHAEQCARIWSKIESCYSEGILDSKVIRIDREHKFQFLVDSTIDAMEDSVKSRSALRWMSARAKES